MATNKSNIVRRAGDTYPVHITIKINGVPLLLTDWDIELRYRKPDGTVYVIDGVITNAEEGKVLVFPHARLKGTTVKLTPDKFVSSELIGKTIPDTDPAEEYTIDMVNQVWDEDEANSEYSYHVVRLRNYNGYVEEQTHISGKIQLLDRFA